MPSANVLPLAYTYCTQTDIENLLSAVGVASRLDQNADSYIDTSEQLAMTDAIEGATETVNSYCYHKYAASILATSRWINILCTRLAANFVAQLRGNEAPEPIYELALAAEATLQDILDGRRTIPGVPLRRKLAPVWSNTRVVPWYQFRCIRVERQNSAQHNPTTLQQNTDYQEAYTFEI